MVGFFSPVLVQYGILQRNILVPTDRTQGEMELTASEKLFLKSRNNPFLKASGVGNNGERYKKEGVRRRPGSELGMRREGTGDSAFKFVSFPLTVINLPGGGRISRATMAEVASRLARRIVPQPLLRNTYSDFFF